MYSVIQINGEKKESEQMYNIISFIHIFVAQDYVNVCEIEKIHLIEVFINLLNSIVGFLHQEDKDRVFNKGDFFIDDGRVNCLSIL